MCISCKLIDMILYSPSSKRCDSCWPPTARDMRSLLYRRGATQYCKREYLSLQLIEELEREFLWFLFWGPLFPYGSLG